MARVEATAHIHAPLEDVYQVAKDVETFPTFMPDVESVKVLERDGPHRDRLVVCPRPKSPVG